MIHKDLKKHLDWLTEFVPRNHTAYKELETKLKELSKHPKNDWNKVVIDENK